MAVRTQLWGHRAKKNKTTTVSRRFPGPHQFRISGVLRDNVGLSMTGMNATARDTCVMYAESQIRSLREISGGRKLYEGLISCKPSSRRISWCTYSAH